MSPFLALLRKEWRDVRTVTLISAVAAVGICLGVRWALLAWGGSDDAGGFPAETWWGFFVPTTVVLYAGTVAADLVGGEVVSRRMDQTATLPVGPWRVWAAKAAFLALATAGFGAWCVLVQWVALHATLGAAQAAKFLEEAVDGKAAALVATCAAATLLASTFRARGLGALLLGLALGVLVCGGAAFLAQWSGLADEWLMGEWEGLDSPIWRRPTVLFALLPLSVLAASAFAFAHGRVHLGRVLRPLAIGLATLAALLVVPAAAIAAQLMTVTPGEAGTALRCVRPSPDGRYVYVEFARWYVDRSRAGYVLDAESGGLRPVAESSELWLHGDADRTWDEDGRLVLLRLDRDTAAEAVVDPATGTTLHERPSAPPRRRMRRDAWREPRPVGVTPDGTTTYSVARAEPAESVEIVSRVQPLVRADGCVIYVREPRVLATRTLPDGDERRLLESAEPWKSGWIGPVSADGRLLAVRHDGAWKCLDVETGRTVDLRVPPELALPFGRPSWVRVEGDASRHLLLVRRDAADPRLDLLDVDTGARRDVDPCDDVEAFALPGGRLLVWKGRREELVVLAPDLTDARRLWPSEGARR